MVISELVEHLIRVKEEYGDCRILISTKPSYDNGVFLDIQDTALARIASDGKNHEAGIILSSCLFVPEETSVEVDAELISRNEMMDSKSRYSTECSRKIFINADDIIKSLFLESKSYYLDFFLIQEFHDYIMKKFRGVKFKGEQILIDSDIASFNLVALSNPDVFRLVDTCIYLKHGHAAKDFISNVDKYVHQLVVDFLQSKEGC